MKRFFLLTLLCLASCGAFAYVPTGALVIAQGGEWFSCPVRSLVWYKVQYSSYDYYFSDGVCPSSESALCAYNLPTAFGNRTLGSFYGDSGQCYVFAGQAALAVAGAASAAAAAPWEYTTAQQADVYLAMARIFGLFLGAMALIWVFKQIIRVLNHNGASE